MKRNPCKKCVVRPSCSQDCEDYEIFRKAWSWAATRLAFVFSGVFIIPIFVIISQLPFENTPYIIGVVYIMCVFLLVLLIDNSNLRLESLPSMFFAPLTLGAVIFIKLVERHIRKYVER